MLGNTSKRVRKVLIRFNELIVHDSDRVVFIPQKYGSRAGILSFHVFPNLRGQYGKNEKNKNEKKKGKKKNFIRTTTLCALLSVFQFTVSLLVRKLLHFFSKVYLRGKNLKN